MTGSDNGRPASLGWATFATSLGFVVVQLDVSIVNVALPAISDARNTTTTRRLALPARLWRRC